MYCKYCGKEIKDESVFCAYCGKSLQISIGEEEKHVIEPTVKHDAENTKENVKKRSNSRTGIIVISVIVLFALTTSGIIYYNQYQKNKAYNEALNLIESKDYIGAYELLTDLNFKNSDELADNLKKEFFMYGKRAFHEYDLEKALKFFQYDGTNNAKTYIKIINALKGETKLNSIYKYFDFDEYIVNYIEHDKSLSKAFLRGRWTAKERKNHKWIDDELYVATIYEDYYIVFDKNGKYETNISLPKKIKTPISDNSSWNSGTDLYLKNGNEIHLDAGDDFYVLTRSQ